MQGFLTKLGLTHSYALLNAYAYALLTSPAMGAIPILGKPAQQTWRNALFAMVVGPRLEAIVTFGSQAKLAIDRRPAGDDQEDRPSLEPRRRTG